MNHQWDGEDWGGLLIVVFCVLIFIVAPLAALSFHISNMNERLETLENKL